MDPRFLIEKYYAALPEARDLLLAHSEAVAKKALETAKSVPNLSPDTRFVEEASLLHDIGMLLTNAPMLGCRGEHPYISHGHLGRKLLEDEGLPLHALVCERHVGVGLTVSDIRNNSFPIPEHDMVPVSIEEKIVAFADKFFSKDRDPTREKTLEEVSASIARYGSDKLKLFDGWVELFTPAR